MQSDNIRKTSDYSVESDLSAEDIIVSLLNFLETHLPEFSEKINIERNIHEEIINQKLLRFFSSKNQLFYFASENRDETEVNKSKPDIGVYEKIEVYDDNQIRFFDIECKRLHDVNKSKQYVSGTTGGIQRFKENKHGVDLPQSAMIGYVETEDFCYWYKKVNEWIADKIDDKEEYLEMLTIQKIAKLQSEHTRTNPQKSKIKLIHFWLKMFNKNKI